MKGNINGGGNGKDVGIVKEQEGYINLAFGHWSETTDLNFQSNILKKNLVCNSGYFYRLENLKESLARILGEGSREGEACQNKIKNSLPQN